MCKYNGHNFLSKSRLISTFWLMVGVKSIYNEYENTAERIEITRSDYDTRNFKIAGWLKFLAKLKFLFCFHIFKVIKCKFFEKLPTYNFYLSVFFVNISNILYKLKRFLPTIRNLKILSVRCYIIQIPCSYNFRFFKVI